MRAPTWLDGRFRRDTGKRKFVPNNHADLTVIVDIHIHALTSAASHCVKTAFRQRLTSAGTSGGGTANGIAGTCVASSAGGLFFLFIAHHYIEGRACGCCQLHFAALRLDSVALVLSLMMCTCGARLAGCRERASSLYAGKRLPIWQLAGLNVTFALVVLLLPRLASRPGPGWAGLSTDANPAHTL